MILHYIILPSIHAYQELEVLLNPYHTSQWTCFPSNQQELDRQDGGTPTGILSKSLATTIPKELTTHTTPPWLLSHAVVLQPTPLSDYIMWHHNQSKLEHCLLTSPPITSSSNWHSPLTFRHNVNIFTFPITTSPLLSQALHFCLLIYPELTKKGILLDKSKPGYIIQSTDVNSWIPSVTTLDRNWGQKPLLTWSTLLPLLSLALHSIPRGDKKGILAEQVQTRVYKVQRPTAVSD